jgi:hypothetical protein
MDFIETNKYIDELRSAGHTWNEVCDDCNTKYGKEYGEAKWRKPYMAWRATIDDVLQDESNIIIEKELERLARAKTRLEINRKVLNAQKQVIDSEVKKETNYELFNLEAVNLLKSLSPKLTPLKLNRTTIDKNFVFVHTDGHYNGTQDLDIHFSEIKELILEQQRLYDFKEIVFAELGDTIEGATMRPSQLMSITQGIVSQALTVARYYTEFLNNLSEYMNINFIIVESSNHTEIRQFGASRSELPEEDLMRVIAEQIKLGTSKNQRINVLSAPRILTEINGIDYLFEHGHNIKNKKTHIKDIESFTNCNIDYAYSGHTHGYETFDTVYVESKGFNKNFTTVGHSNTAKDDFANKLLLSSAPAIHFSIDTNKGKEHQENLILRESLKKTKVL